MASGSESMSYLQRLATELDREPQSEKLIVFPNKRSLYVFQAIIGKCDGIELCTVDDLMTQLSGMQLIEPEELMVAFYQVYRAHESSPMPFDQFTNWATTFLSDANDIDLYMGDVSAIFQCIKEYHETGEGFHEGDRGPLEAGFLSFWEKLPHYYNQLNEALSKVNLAYRGQVYRKVAQMAQGNHPDLASKFSGKHCWWVGIIPGNPSEQQLLKWIEANGTLARYADMDRIYLDNEFHEAGRLFRASGFKANWTEDILRTKSMEVKIYTVSGVIAQCIAARDIVNEIPKTELANTVIVIPDQQLLTPFLVAFEDITDQLNLSMGISLRQTLIHRFVMNWVNLHSQATKKDGETYFYHRNLLKLIDYPVIKAWLQPHWSEIYKEMVARNIKSVPASWLKERLNKDIFSQQAFELLFDWPDETSGVLDKISTLVQDWLKSKERLHGAYFESAALPLYQQRIKQLMAQYNEVLDHGERGALVKFLNRHISYSTVRLEGANNDGIQVMGMLETRMVDFKHVIVIGANDDVLPGNPMKASFIPFIHRITLKLPTYKDSEALIAYHFYRLIQRCEQLHMIYSTSTQALRGGEPSRYIRQLELELAQENKNARITRVVNDAPLIDIGDMTIKVEKRENVMASVKAYLRSRLSPSALAKFMNSPLEFYFYYVLGVKEEKVVEEVMESSTFGSAVHAVLEALYMPYKGRVVDISTLEKNLEEIRLMTIAEFEKNFQPEDLKRGRNLIQVEMAMHFIKRFVLFDIDDMRTHGPVTIVDLEVKLRPRFEVRELPAQMVCFADRIDMRNGMIRIIDYKTGKVENRDVKTTWEQMIHGIGKPKALQLALYKWAYSKLNNKPAEHIVPCIISFRNQNLGWLELEVEDGDFNAGFEETLRTLIEQILDTEVPFMHKPESMYVTL